MNSTSIHIASVMYDAAHRCWHSLVQFFAPGVPVPLSIPVVLDGPQDVSHARLVQALVHAAQHRGIGV